jgi:hypothetical protein
LKGLQPLAVVAVLTAVSRRRQQRAVNTEFIGQSPELGSNHHRPLIEPANTKLAVRCVQRHLTELGFEPFGRTPKILGRGIKTLCQ